MADKTKQIFGEKNRVKVGSFTRNTALASGDQVVGGVGFEPKAVYFFNAQDSVVGEMSLGMDDGIGHKCITDRHNVVPDQWDRAAGSSILVYEAGATLYYGHVSSFSSDGFTISWVRGGAPSGTLTIIYLAIR